MLLWLAIDEAPAYPASPRLAHHDVAIVAELETTGRFRTALGSAAMTVVQTAALANSLVAYRRSPAGSRSVAELDGARWLVAHP